MVKLFIVGIPRDMNEIELLEMFIIHGQVDQVKIITDINTGESKGYGFVDMTDEPGADRAIAGLDGSYIDERQISVRIAEDKRPAPPAAKVFKADTTERKKRPRKRF